MSVPDFCKQYSLYLGLILLALISSSMPVMANDFDVSDDVFFADIPVVLSATRLSQPLTDAPSAITVIDREMIEASSAIEIPDLFRLVPGFQVAMPMNTKYAVTYHGVTDSGPRRMQILINGRSTYIQLMSTVEWNSLGITLNDIDRVEVIRGPNAPAYGTNAFLGTINIITKQAFQDKGSKVQALVGSLDTRNYYVRHGGAFGELDYRLTAAVEQNDGFENANDHKDIASFSFSGTRWYSPETSLDVQLGFSNGVIGGWANGRAASPPRERDVEAGFLFAKWRTVPDENEELHVQFYINHYKTEDEYQFAEPLSGLIGVAPSTIPLLFGGQPDQVISWGIRSHEAQRFDLEVQHTTALSEEVRVVWGGSIRSDRLKSFRGLNKDDYVYDHGQRLFVNAELRPHHQLIVNAGVMGEKNDLIGSNAYPRLAVNYKVNEHNAFRLAYSKAKRTPSLLEEEMNSVVYFNDGSEFDYFAISAGDLEPEEIQSYELGYIGDLLPHKLLIEAKLFREELDNLIAVPFNNTIDEPFFNNGTLYWVNGGDAIIKGIEGQVKYLYQPKTLFSVQLSYAEAEGKVLERMTPSGNTYDDLEDGVPEKTISVLGSHTFANDTQLSATYYYMDKVEWLGSGDEVDSYDRVDLKVRKGFKLGSNQVNLSLIVQNALDDEYSEFVEKNIFERRTFLQLDFSL